MAHLHVQFQFVILFDVGTKSEHKKRCIYMCDFKEHFDLLRAHKLKTWKDVFECAISKCILFHVGSKTRKKERMHLHVRFHNAFLFDVATKPKKDAFT